MLGMALGQRFAVEQYLKTGKDHWQHSVQLSIKFKPAVAKAAGLFLTEAFTDKHKSTTAFIHQLVTLQIQNGRFWMLTCEPVWRRAVDQRWCTCWTQAATCTFLCISFPRWTRIVQASHPSFDLSHDEVFLFVFVFHFLPRYLDFGNNICFLHVRDLFLIMLSAFKLLFPKS